MKFLVLIILIFFIANSCNQKGDPLNESDLKGISFKEHVELPDINYSQTSIISFHENGVYKRTGMMYVYSEGKYYIENDVLEIHYACGNHCKHDSSCGIQQYIFDIDGNLNLIYLRESDGHIEDLTDTPFDLELERIRN